MLSFYKPSKKKFIPPLRPTTSCSYDGSCSTQSLKCSLLEFFLFWLKLKVQLELVLRITFENLRFLICNQSQKKGKLYDLSLFWVGLQDCDVCHDCTPEKFWEKHLNIIKVGEGLHGLSLRWGIYTFVISSFRLYKQDFDRYR